MQIQGRVLDASIYGWVSDVTVTLAAATYATKDFVDASISARDVSIAYLSNENLSQDASIDGLNSDISDINTYQGIQDTSISTLFDENDTQDASIDGINTNIDNIETYNSKQDASISDIKTTIDASIDGLNSDVSNIWSYNAIQDASILAYEQNDVTYAYVDGSLATRDTNISTNQTNISDASTRIDTNTSNITTNETNISDASTKIDTNTSNITTNETNISNNDVSIAWLNTNKLEASDIADFYDKTYIDGSLNLKQDLITDGTYVKEASIGTGLSWNSGLLDVSIIADVTKAYVDGSLGLRDVSIAWLADNAIGTSQEYVDGSLATRDTLIDINITNISDASTRIDLNETNISDASTRINDNTTNISNNDVSISYLDENKIGYGYDASSLTNIQEENVIISNTGISSTYSTLEDWIDLTQSSGKLTGGTFTDLGDGSLNISAGTGMIRATNDPTAEVLFFDWDECTCIDLPMNTTSYIHVDYNSGTPILNHSLTNTANNRNIIALGKVYKESSTIYTYEAGMNIAEATKNILSRFVQTDGELTRASGGVVSEVGTRQIATTAGVVWGGLTRLSFDGLNTSTGDDFEYYYYDGADWVETTETTISNTQYNNITSGLDALNNNQFGITWVYITGAGRILCLYGQDSYTLGEAQDAQPPGELPPHISQFSFLSAKIIIEKNDTTFTEIQSAFDIGFTSGAPAIHNDLAGLNDGDYVHLTAAEYADRVGKLYVDGSLGLRDTSIAWLVDNLGTGTIAGLSDVSISGVADKDGLTYNSTTGDWEPINSIDIEGYFTSFDYVDGSLSTLWDYNAIQDASIAGFVGDVTKAYVDGSISTIWDYNAIQDASIAAGGGGGSATLAGLSDVSIGSEINDQVLAYDTDGSTYMNKTLVDSSLYSVVDASDYFWILKDTSIDYSTIAQDQTLAFQVDTSRWENKTLVDTSLYSVEDGSVYFTRRLQTETKLGDADGSLGDWSIDSDYLYLCTDDASWGRISLDRF